MCFTCYVQPNPNPCAGPTTPYEAKREPLTVVDAVIRALPAGAVRKEAKVHKNRGPGQRQRYMQMQMMGGQMPTAPQVRTLRRLPRKPASMTPHSLYMKGEHRALCGKGSANGRATERYLHPVGGTLSSTRQPFFSLAAYLPCLTAALGAVSRAVLEEGALLATIAWRDAAVAGLHCTADLLRSMESCRVYWVLVNGASVLITK